MRVTVTIPAYLEKQFVALSTELGLSNQDTFLHCLTNALAWKSVLPEPSGPTARTTFALDLPEVPDLYLAAAPEPLKVYTFNDAGSCLRGEEIGEYHEIKRGDRYSWQKFSRHSKEGAEGWEIGKNGKLCEACHPIVRDLWNSHIIHF